METPPPGYVSVPGIDTPYYFSLLVDFFIGHKWDFWMSAKNLVGAVVAVSIPVTLFFFFAIVYTVERIKHIRNLEDDKYNKPPKPTEPTEKEVDKVDEELARRWHKVISHVDSSNPNDWKQAIIEADVMLDQLVTKLGYRGDSLGEKLKRTVRGDFKTKDEAWDAHMVRNRIAHDGSDYQINQHEAKRVIGQYRKVFDEFYHISG